MKAKLLIVLTISFIITNLTLGQESKAGANFTRTMIDKDFSPDKVYYKETGKKMPLSEFRIITQGRVYFEREIDEEGHVIRYFYDPNNQKNTGNSSTYISENATLPNFKLTTIDKKQIELKNLIGKLVILRFELEANSFRFKKQEIVALDKKINALSNKKDVEAIIIFGCSEDEVRKGFDIDNSNFKLVADGENFIIKYGIHNFPSTLLIDQNGKLIENFSSPESIILEDYLKNK